MSVLCTGRSTSVSYQTFCIEAYVDQEQTDRLDPTEGYGHRANDAHLTDIEQVS